MKPDKKPFLIAMTIGFGLSAGLSLGAVLDSPPTLERVACCAVGTVALFLYISTLVEHILNRLEEK